MLRVDQYIVIYIHTKGSKSSMSQIWPYFAKRQDCLLCVKGFHWEGGVVYVIHT